MTINPDNPIQTRTQTEHSSDTENDLSFDELAELRELTEAPAETHGELTPGECEMARGMAEDGLPYGEIAELMPIDERQLTLHIDGYCECDRQRRAAADEERRGGR